MTTTNYNTYDRIIINKNDLELTTDFNIFQNKLNEKVDNHDDKTLDFDEFLVGHFYPEELEQEKHIESVFRSIKKGISSPIKQTIGRCDKTDRLSIKNVLKPIKGISI